VGRVPPAHQRPGLRHLGTGPGARPVAGDFNADGRMDIALTGGTGWTTIPVASATGGGGWTITNAGAVDFGTWAQSPT
jgi:hypothetical protein